MALTPTQTRLVDAMRTAIDIGEWQRVANDYGFTIRWRSEEKDVGEERGGWKGPYHSLVFVTFVGSKVILGVASAPWTGRRDQDITYKRAFTVIENPAGQVC